MVPILGIAVLLLRRMTISPRNPNQPFGATTGLELRRIDLTPRSLERPPWWWMPKRAKRGLVTLGFMAPILGMVVLLLPGPRPVNLGAPGFERTSFLAPLQQVIRLAVAHPDELTSTPATAPPSVPSPLAPAPSPPAAATAEAPAVAALTTTQAPVTNLDTSRAAGWAASAPVACIRQHESGDDYGANTGNGYYGAYQDLLSTWRAAGGTGLPSDAPPAVQDQINYQIWISGGWGQWSTASMCGV